MTRALALATALLFSVGDASAQSASGVDLTWMVGSWEAHPANGAATIELTIMPPNAGLLLGVMRLVVGNTIGVVELFAVVDAPKGPEMRFRHFSSALEAYESDFRQTMLLTSHTADRFVFENQVPYDKALPSTQPRTTTYTRHGPDEFFAHSDIFDGQGKPAVVEATYRRKKS